MDERMEEELEVVFELGCIKGSLKKPKLFSQVGLTVLSAYLLFKTLATRLCIDLPDPPPHETTAEDKIDEFYSNQVTHVQNYLLEHKTNYVQKIFSIGDHVQQLLSILSTCTESESLWEQNEQRLPKLVKKLEILAKSIGIDITEELEKIDYHKKFDDNDVNTLKLQLRKKLCKRASQPTHKRSVVDTTRIITDDYWAISLVRLPDSGHKPHAFLVLEGMTGNKSMVWFFVFGANDAFDILCPGERNGRVTVDYHESFGNSLSQCHEKLIEIRKAGRWLHETWHITQGTAQKLIQCINEWQAKPPECKEMSSSKLAASSEILVSTTTSHDSLTFARMILLDLKDENITIPEDTLEDWIFSVQYNDKWWELSRFSLIVTFVAGAVIGYSFLKLW